MTARNRKEKSLSDTRTHSQMALLVMDVQVGIVTRFAQTGDFLKPINTAIRPVSVILTKRYDVPYN